MDASGNPNGTIKGGGSPASKVFAGGALTAGDYLWYDLDNPYTPTRGEMLSQVVKYDSGTIDGSNSLTIALCLDQGNSSFNLNNVAGYSILNSAGSRTRLNTRLPIYGYGSATRAYGRPLESTATTGNLNATTTPDEVGQKFNPPTDWMTTYQVAGVDVDFKPVTGQTVRLRLYDTDGSTVLHEVTYDTDHLTQNTQTGLTRLLFTDAVLATLNAGNTYRWTLFMASGNWNVCYIAADAAADWDAWPYGRYFSWTERTDAGAWTDTPTRKIIGQIVLGDRSV